jgi:predicted nucleotidyltransferase
MGECRKTIETMKLVEFTKEGLIIDALAKEPLRFRDLKQATGLSDAWLSKKLRELLRAEILSWREGRYFLNGNVLRQAMRGEKAFTAKLVAHEIAERDDVVLVALFGSLAREPTRDADIDLLIVTHGREFDPLQTSLEAFRKFGVSVDILHLGLKDLLAWFFEKPPILFGFMRGYRVLYDGGCFGELLKLLEKEIREEWVYLKEGELWVKKELLQHISRPRWSTWKPPRS